VSEELMFQLNDQRKDQLESKVKGMINTQQVNHQGFPGNANDPVVNNNININKISINNYYNRQDPSQELYSMRSKKA
jgi:hypothetical protein